MTKTIKLTAFKRRRDEVYLSSVEEIGNIVIINYSPKKREAYLIESKYLDDFIREVNEVGLDIPFDEFDFIEIIDTIKES